MRLEHHTGHTRIARDRHLVNVFHACLAVKTNFWIAMVMQIKRALQQAVNF
jgi:hypothetical protein